MSAQQELQQLSQQLQELRDEIENLEDEADSLRDDKSDIDEAIDALEALETGATIQVPVGGGAYVRAEVQDMDEVIVTLGGDYAAEQPEDDAIETLENKKDALDDRIEDVTDDIDDLENEADQLESKAQQLQQQAMQQQLQQQQAMQQQGADEDDDE